MGLRGNHDRIDGFAPAIPVLIKLALPDSRTDWKASGRKSVWFGTVPMTYEGGLP